MLDIPEQNRKCCGQLREKEIYCLTSTKAYKQRIIKVYTCPKCSSKKMVTLFTDRADEVTSNYIEKTKEVKNQLEIYLKEKISPPKPKIDTSKYDKFHPKTVLNDNFTFFVPAIKNIYEQDANGKIITIDNKRIVKEQIEYQTEKKYISEYVTGYKTLKHLTTT